MKILGSLHSRYRSSQLRIYENRFKDKQKAFKKEYKFFESNEHCLTCHQTSPQTLMLRKLKLLHNSERSTKQQSNSRKLDNLRKDSRER